MTSGQSGVVNTTAEIYDPVTNTWQTTPPLLAGRWRHTATLLPSGAVLIVGGDTTVDYFAATAEIYYPVTNTWRSARDMAIGRTGHTATLLPDGRVAVAGGDGSDGPLTSTEYYDPATDQWAAV